MYKQVTTPNWNISYKGGWCLKYVNDAFGGKLRQNNATASYNIEKANGNIHMGIPPLEVYTPVYFALSNQPLGHVAIALPDGRIASSSLNGEHPTPYIHKDLADIINAYSDERTCTYLGWSEKIDGAVAVKWENEEVPSRFPFKTNLKRGTSLYNSNGNRYSNPTSVDREVNVLGEVGNKYKVEGKTFNPNIVYVLKSSIDGTPYPYSATVKRGSLLYNEYGKRYNNPTSYDRTVTVLGEINGKLKVSGKTFNPNIVYCDKSSVK